jgi:LIM domain
MHDHQRSSPQPLPPYRSNTGILPAPAHPHASDDGSLQPASPPVSNVRLTHRAIGLNRSSTMGTPHDWNKSQNTESLPPHPASDQGHTRPSEYTFANAHLHGPLPGSSSRPSSSSGISLPYSDENPRSPASSASVNTSASSSAISQGSSSSASTAMSAQPCSACGLPMSGQFVRALGSVYHLDCFRCRVCVTYRSALPIYLIPFILFIS